MHRPILSDIRLTTVFGDIQEDAARDDAVTPFLHGAEFRAFKGDLARRITTIPHAAFIPCMTERVQVRGGYPMIKNPVVVNREAACSTRDSLHPMLRRVCVPGAGVLGKVSAERNASSTADERGSLHALLRGDQVDRAQFIVLSPSTPIATIPQIRQHLFARR